MQKKRAHFRKSASMLSLSMLALLTQANAFAGASSTWFDTHRLHPFATVMGGSAYSNNLGITDKIYTTPVDFFRYSLTSQKRYTFTGGVFAGFEAPLNAHWNMQFGPSYYALNTLSLRGTVRQGENGYPQYDDYIPASVRLKLREILLQGKWLYMPTGTPDKPWLAKIHPYFTAGLGNAINKTENPQTFPPDYTCSPDLLGKTTHSFAYLLGLGLDIDVMQHVRFGLGYVFNHYGKAEMVHPSTHDIPTRFSVRSTDLHANEWMAQLTVVG